MLFLLSRLCCAMNVSFPFFSWSYKWKTRILKLFEYSRKELLFDIFNYNSLPLNLLIDQLRSGVWTMTSLPPFLPLLFADFPASSKDTYCETGKKLQLWQFINFKTKKKKKKEIGKHRSKRIWQKGSSEEKLDINWIYWMYSCFKLKWKKKNPRIFHRVFKKSGKLGCLKSVILRDVLLIQTCNIHFLFLTYHVFSIYSYLGYAQLLPASCISSYWKIKIIHFHPWNPTNL